MMKVSIEFQQGVVRQDGDWTGFKALLPVDLAETTRFYTYKYGEKAYFSESAKEYMNLRPIEIDFSLSKDTLILQQQK